MAHEGVRQLERAPAKNPALLLLPLVLLAGAGAVLILFSASRGVGVGYDSIFYLTSAGSLREGNGLQWRGSGGELRPLVHYPPLYPMVLAGMQLLGLEQVAAATWVSAILFGANVALAGFLVYQASRHSGAALACSLLALASPILLDVHLEAMSEPLFLFWLLTSLSALLAYLRKSSRWFLVLAGLAAGLSYLTRYVGAAMVATGILAVAFRPQRFRSKGADLALFAAAGLLPTLAWYARNVLLTGYASNRVLGFHPISLVNLRACAETVTCWALPASIDLRVRAALLLGVGLFASALVVLDLNRSARARAADQGGNRASWPSFEAEGLLALFAFLYAALLAFSLTFLDASTRLGDRILSPAYLVLMVAAFSLWRKLSPLLRRAGALAALLLFGLYLSRSWALVADMRADGRGFNSREWQSSGTLQLLSALPADAVLYTNEAFPVQFLTGRPAYGVPEAVDSVKGLPRPDFEAQMAAMQERLRSPNSALAVFLGEHYRVELPPLEELAAGLQRVATANDGEIYVDPANAEGMPWP